MEKIVNPNLSTRAARLLWWLAPVLFLLWMGRYGLQSWFMQDDFAWLGLLRTVPESRSLLNALFAPEAQGTIRPLSERGFFLLFESLFGLSSLPYHLCVFATLAADTVLLGWITRRITHSRVAGFLAPVFWVGNSALATVFVWNSVYNEALCAFFLLAAFALLVRFVETGRWIFWWWQLVVFTLGFGALEVNVVYPALAAGYAVLIARMPPRRLVRILGPLFGISILYFFLHRAAAPLPVSGPYAVHVDARILQTLTAYWNMALIPEKWGGRLLFRGPALFWGLTILVAAFLIRELWKSRYVVLFGLVWFLIALAPMLPIPAHITDYYLTIPLIGLAMVGAWGVLCAWRSPWLPLRIAVVLLAAGWLNIMVKSSLLSSHWWRDRSREVRAMVLGVAAAQQAHPEQTIVLAGVTSELYDDAIAESAFYPLGLDYVYLTPGSADTIHPRVNPELLPQMTLDPGVMKNALTHQSVVVYSVLSDRLRNITEAYERSSFSLDTESVPRRIDVGNPLFGYLLGPEWFSVESGIRWMPRRATVRIGGPASVKDKLLLKGYCPEQQLRAGVLHVSVSVDGIPLQGAQIGSPENSFRRLFDVPPSLVGQRSVEISISVDRVFHEDGGRELGLIFGAIGFER